jgi:hypothetical protein
MSARVFIMQDYIIYQTNGFPATDVSMSDSCYFDYHLPDIIHCYAKFEVMRMGEPRRGHLYHPLIQVPPGMCRDRLRIG